MDKMEGSRKCDKTIGFWLNEKKCKKFDLPEFIEECRKLNMRVVKLQLSEPLDEQGPFDVILHKMTAVYAQALDGSLEARHHAENFEKYLRMNGHIPVVDPVSGIHTLLHRPATYALLQAITHNDDQIMTPPYVELADCDLESKKQKLIKAGLTFPIVCKPVVGCGGTEAHELAVVLSMSRLAEWRGPCVAQSFIQHSAVLYKLYVLGNKWHLVVRPSLKNFRATDAPTVHFNSSKVSKADSCSPLTQLDQKDRKEPLPLPQPEVFDRIVQLVRESINMDLLGIDVVIDSSTGQYAIIDVNPFPSYDTIIDLMPCLATLLYNKIESSRQAQKLGKVVQQPSTFTSSISDFFLPLEISDDGTVISRPKTNTCCLDIPQLLVSRGHLKDKSVFKNIANNGMSEVEHKKYNTSNRQQHQNGFVCNGNKCFDRNNDLQSLSVCSSTLENNRMGYITDSLGSLTDSCKKKKNLDSCTMADGGGGLDTFTDSLISSLNECDTMPAARKTPSTIGNGSLSANSTKDSMDSGVLSDDSSPPSDHSIISPALLSSMMSHAAAPR